MKPTLYHKKKSIRPRDARRLPDIRVGGNPLEDSQVSLLVCGAFLEDAVAARWRKFLEVCRGSAGEALEAPQEAFRELWSAAAERLMDRPGLGRRHSLGEILLEAFLEEDNPVHRFLQKEKWDAIGGTLKEIYRREALFLLRLFRMDWDEFAENRIRWKGPWLRGLAVSKTAPDAWGERRLRALCAILDADSEEESFSKLITFFKTFGGAKLSRFAAFRWKGKSEKLEPIDAWEEVPWESLVGYEPERRLVFETLHRFTRGHAVPPLLLYGDSGTGKSSTLKAAFGRLVEEGLRWVEVLPGDTLNFSELWRALRDLPGRFLLVLDDFSFDTDDERYRFVKAMLEGTVETQPKNLLLCATSNRRHLIPDVFDVEREVRPREAREEKLSLSDRFALAVGFFRPGQDLYLEMVASWLQRMNKKPREGWRNEALRFALEQNGFSGRTARAFAYLYPFSKEHGDGG